MSIIFFCSSELHFLFTFLLPGTRWTGHSKVSLSSEGLKTGIQISIAQCIVLHNFLFNLQNFSCGNECLVFTFLFHFDRAYLFAPSIALPKSFRISISALSRSKKDPRLLGQGRIGVLWIRQHKFYTPLRIFCRLLRIFGSCRVGVFHILQRILYRFSGITLPSLQPKTIPLPLILRWLRILPHRQCLYECTAPSFLHFLRPNRRLRNNYKLSCSCLKHQLNSGFSYCLYLKLIIWLISKVSLFWRYFMVKITLT